VTAASGRRDLSIIRLARDDDVLPAFHRAMLEIAAPIFNDAEAFSASRRRGLSRILAPRRRLYSR
jgi:hypothetical protein